MGYRLSDLLSHQRAIVLLLSLGIACQLHPGRAESSHIRSPGAKPKTYRRQQGRVIIATGYEAASDQPQRQQMRSGAQARYRPMLPRTD